MVKIEISRSLIHATTLDELQIVSIGRYRRSRQHIFAMTLAYHMYFAILIIP